MKINPRNLRRGIPPGTLLGRGAGRGAAQILTPAQAVKTALAGGAGGVLPASLPAVPSGDLLANLTAGTTFPSGVAGSAFLDYVFGSTEGMVLYRDVTVWKALTIGAANTLLVAGAIPVWETLSTYLSATIGGAAGTLPIASNTNTWTGLAPPGAQRILTITSLGNIQWQLLSVEIDNEIGNTVGSILYRDTSLWKLLSPGTAGYFLQTPGANAAPVWAAVPGVLPGGGATGDVLVFGASGAAWDGPLTNGQLIIGSTSAQPVAAVLTAGTGINITNAAGSITIATPLIGLPSGVQGDTLGYKGVGGWSAIGPLANGQLLIGATSADPAAATLTAGSNITITNAANAISIAATVPVGANPTATAGPAAINGTAATFMRSDGAPAVQKASAAQFGIVEVDGTSITAAGGVISAAGLYAPVLGTNVPTLAGIGFSTWVNQGSVTAVDTPMGPYFSGPSDGFNVDQFHGFIQNAPATPYTRTAWLLPTNSFNYWGPLLGWSNGTAFDLLQAVMQSNGTATLVHGTFSSATVLVADVNLQVAAPFSPMIWRIQDDGTNIHMYFSVDGFNFVTLYTIAKASGYLGSAGYSKLALGIDLDNSNGSFTLRSWG